MGNKFRDFINNKDYGLLNSKHNLIDSLVELCTEIKNQNPEIKFANEDIFRNAVEIKLRQMMEAYKSSLDEVKVQVLDILNSKNINNGNDTPTKEKDENNGHKGKD